MGSNPLVIYHGNCYDGFTAAWVFWRAFGGKAELFAARYGDPPPSVEGREVYVVDFSYPSATMLEMKDAADALDHEDLSLRLGWGEILDRATP